MMKPIFDQIYITGDTHRDFSRFKLLDPEITQNPNNAIIILGDAGINWDLGTNDHFFKASLARKYKCSFYCVRGNHEARPQSIPGMILEFDPKVKNEVYYEPEFPTIRYFKDFGLYCINDYDVYVIGGAYSVDKQYRLERGYTWFDDEQLDFTEQKLCIEEIRNLPGVVDFVFTHTCPLSWEPNDLFLNGIDQRNVDKTMEDFLDEVKERLVWDVWLFGHYHADRLERPCVQQMYTNIEDINQLYFRWFGVKDDLQIGLMPKSPNYYQGAF